MKRSLSDPSLTICKLRSNLEKGLPQFFLLIREQKKSCCKPLFKVLQQLPEIEKNFFSVTAVSVGDPAACFDQFRIEGVDGELVVADDLAVVKSQSALLKIGLKSGFT